MQQLRRDGITAAQGHDSIQAGLFGYNGILVDMAVYLFSFGTTTNPVFDPYNNLVKPVDMRVCGCRKRDREAPGVGALYVSLPACNLGMDTSGTKRI